MHLQPEDFVFFCDDFCLQRGVKGFMLSLILSIGLSSYVFIEERYNECTIKIFSFFSPASTHFRQLMNTYSSRVM